MTTQKPNKLKVIFNNPGNLEKGQDFAGETDDTYAKDRKGDKKPFAVFDSPEMGIRALAMDLQTKIKRHSGDINKIVAEYAPDNENDTKAYQSFVKTKLKKDKVTDKDLKHFVQAIIEKENSPSVADYYLDNPDLVTQGVAMSYFQLPSGTPVSKAKAEIIAKESAMKGVLNRDMEPLGFRYGGGVDSGRSGGQGQSRRGGLRGGRRAGPGQGGNKQGQTPGGPGKGRETRDEREARQLRENQEAANKREQARIATEKENQRLREIKERREERKKDEATGKFDSVPGANTFTPTDPGEQQRQYEAEQKELERLQQIQKEAEERYRQQLSDDRRKERKGQSTTTGNSFLDSFYSGDMYGFGLFADPLSSTYNQKYIEAYGSGYGTVNYADLEKIKQGDYREDTYSGELKENTIVDTIKDTYKDITTFGSENQYQLEPRKDGFKFTANFKKGGLLDRSHKKK